MKIRISHTIYVFMLFLITVASCKKDDDCDAGSKANAGADQNLAGNTTTLDAQAAQKGTGSWTIISGEEGVIEELLNPTSKFSGKAGSTYVLKWTITGCPASEDEVQVTFNCNPVTVSNAGADQEKAGTSTMLAANTPTAGTGAWSIVSGVNGQIASPSSPTSTFSGVAGSTYVLKWTITGCNTSEDEVTISFTCDTANASAGDDKVVDGTTTSLAGNVAQGTWSIVSGDGGNIVEPTNPTSSFSGVAGSIYVLKWTTTGCKTSEDEVQISFTCDVAATAVAGDDKTVVGTTTSLAGNDAPGTWSITSGDGGNIAEPTNPISTFSGTAGVTYVLRWTVSCPQSYDEVQITFAGNNPLLISVDKTNVINGDIITITGLNFDSNYNGGSQINIIKVGDPYSGAEVFLPILSRTSTEIKAVVVGTNGGAGGVYNLRYNQRPTLNPGTIIASDLSITIGSVGVGQFFTTSTFTESNVAKGAEASFGVKNGSLVAADYTITLIQYNYTTGTATATNATVTGIVADGYGGSMDKITFSVPADLASEGYDVKVTYGGSSVMAGWGTYFYVN